MKSNHSILSVNVAMAFALSISACGDARKQKNESSARTEMNHEDHNHADYEVKHDHVMHETSTTSSNVSREQAQKILSAYLEIKNALVKTDGDDAAKAANGMSEILGADADAQIEMIRVDVQYIAGTTDTQHQRGHFNTLSEAVYQMIKATKANEATLYRQHCPMAFNNTGAYWLSADKEVFNPYFGDKMLHCGSVKEEL